MVVFGVSQSSGVERRLEVDAAGNGVALRIVDHVGGVERDRIVVLGAELMAAIIGAADGVSTIRAAAPTEGGGRQLDVEVCRNEVQLRTHAVGQKDWDIAVGLDDFQDALEGVVTGE